MLDTWTSAGVDAGHLVERPVFMAACWSIVCCKLHELPGSPFSFQVYGPVPKT